MEPEPVELFDGGVEVTPSLSARGPENVQTTSAAIAKIRKTKGPNSLGQMPCCFTMLILGETPGGIFGFGGGSRAVQDGAVQDGAVRDCVQGRSQRSQAGSLHRVRIGINVQQRTV